MFLLIPTDAVEYDAKAVKKVLKKKENAGWHMLGTLQEKLAALEDWSAASLEACIATIVEEQQAKLGDVAQPLRVAISGTTVSPSIAESLARLGKETTLERIDRCRRQCAPEGE